MAPTRRLSLIFAVLSTANIKNIILCALCDPAVDTHLGESCQKYNKKRDRIYEYMYLAICDHRKKGKDIKILR